MLKFWLHLDQEAQRLRLRRLEKDPLQCWRVREDPWRNWKLYDRFVGAAERALSVTSTENAPWTVVEGSDVRYCAITVATRIRDAIHKALAPPARVTARSAVNPAEKIDSAQTTRRDVTQRYNVLFCLDMTRGLDKPIFQRELTGCKGISTGCNDWRRTATTVLVFEGWDTA